MKKVIIHTDGSCLGNPGAGGWAAVLTLEGGNHRRELGGGFRLTTNNRMELLAAINGLAALKRPCLVDLYTDSQYLSNAVTRGWLFGWHKQNYLRKGNKPVPNADLWRLLLPLLAKYKPNIFWLRGHTGHAENERCDQLARDYASQANLPPDEAYEKLLKEVANA